MDLDIVRRLEVMVDRLLAKNRELLEERDRLKAVNRDLVAEREQFGTELDRILEKLDRLDREG